MTRPQVFRQRGDVIVTAYPDNARTILVTGADGRDRICNAEAFHQRHVALETQVDIADVEAFRAARLQHVNVRYQEGHLKEVGVNGCFVEDVIENALDRLLFFQGQDLSCEENDKTIAALKEALHWQAERRRIRVEQGVANSYQPHASHHDFHDEADVRPIYDDRS